MTEGNSRAVVSPQAGPHQRLEETVSRHLLSEWQRPVGDPTRVAFSRVQSWLVSAPPSLVLDSGCGTGESTRQLAALHPDAAVIGIDKSADRLSRHGDQGDGYLLVRADLNDFWRLAVAEGWRLSHHYLLYPNPWPKPSQLNKRRHGSPAFPTILALGGRLEMRTNWRIYAEEFAAALTLAGRNPGMDTLVPVEPVCPFERKYASSGQTLYRVDANLDQD